MAGPGGKEVGRLAIKVVPDTDGFRRKVETLVKELSDKDINIEVDPTGIEEAKAQVDELARDRDINLKIVLKKANKVAKQIDKIARDRIVKLKIRVDAGNASAEISKAARKRSANIKVDADAGKASAQIDKAARDRKAKIKYVFDGGDEATKRLLNLKRREVTDLVVHLDDKRARVQLRALGRDGKIVAKVDVDRSNIEALRSWSKSLGGNFREASRELNSGFERSVRLQRQMSILAEEERKAKAKERSDLAAAQRLERERIADLRRAAKLAETQDKQRASRLATALSRELEKLGSDLPHKVRWDVEDPKAKVAILMAELERMAKVKLNVDLSGERTVGAKLALLARTRRAKIKADVDKNNLSTIGRVVDTVFQGVAGTALGALGGVAKGLAVISSGLGNFGNVGQKIFGRLADATQQTSSKAGQAAAAISQVVATIGAMAIGVTVIYAVVSALGALIVAALSAVAALAAVAIGAAALLVLPALFAGIGYAMISLSSRHAKLQKQFGKLKQTLIDTFAKVGAPMLNFFSDSLDRLNKNLKSGSLLSNLLSTGFEEATKALTPLRSGLAGFVKNGLRGVNDALERLNKSGSYNIISHGISGLGLAIGHFASTIGNYGPQFAVGFNSLVSGLDSIGVSLGNWVGRFSNGAPAVIDSFANATAHLLDQFSSNSATYMKSARALGDSLNYAVPGFEKITAAFANMSPTILDSFSAGIARLGDALSDPSTQTGLAQLTTALIDFSAQAIAAGAKMTGWMGSALKGMGNGWDLLNRDLSDHKQISQKLFQKLIHDEGTTREKINKGLQQLDLSFKKSSDDVGKWMGTYADRAVSGMNKVEGKSASHLQKLAGTLKTLAQQWKDAGGKVGQSWYDAWNQASQEVDASGNSMLQLQKDQMGRLVQDSAGYRDRIKANLVNALKAEGVNVDDSVIAKIDNALGIMADSAGKKSAEMISNLQKNMALMPGIIQTALNDAKTPEQLQQKLGDIQKVMDVMTPQIAQSFGKLPTQMQQTLAQSTAAFQSWTGMEAFKQQVTTGVTAATQQFTNLAKTITAMGPQVASLSVILTSVGSQATTLGSSMGTAAIGARSFATNMTASATGINQLSTSLTTAAGGVNTLSSRVNTAAGAVGRIVTNASSARGALTALAGGADGAGGRFSAFAGRVSGYMVLAAQSVRDWTNNMLATLQSLAGKATGYGQLSGFVGSIRSSMSQAQSAVSSAVSSMLSQLQRLNTTVTAHVNIERNETTHKKTVTEPSDSPTPNLAPNSLPITPFAATAFDSPALRTLDATADAVGQSVSVWRSGAWKAMDGRKNSSDSKDGVTKNFTFNNTITKEPNEKEFIKASRFADALFGT